jgi:alkaline phosphatase
MISEAHNPRNMMRTAIVFVIFGSAAAFAAGQHARNVILFIGDAGGIPTLNAASLYAYDAPQKLFIQSLPNLALVDTSSANSWVTDSAAGMSAIVTGQKTNNGVISQSADAVRGEKDGEWLKTILEYAEDHGLSTGVLSNMNITDATPAACYAHSNDRKSSAEIFAQITRPRFGDGVDLVIGAGRDEILTATLKTSLEMEKALAEKGYAFAPSMEAVPANANRAVVLYESGEFEAWPVVNRAIDILSRNDNGFFLMVEWDMHTTQLERGLKRAVEMDSVIRETAAKMNSDTLLLFVADHSFDLRLRGGRQHHSLLPDPAAPSAKPVIRVENGHTGEEVLAAAMGPGAERVRGFIPNTELFHVMMSAFGWTAGGARTAPAATASMR